ncbi:MAG: CDP-diacylglycerol--serine O-phosphatidyltransferase [Thermosulfidibacteraceae bacterium]|jgi:CDP-diacylglycerol--serine O-phosphatidyltransferase
MRLYLLPNILTAGNLFFGFYSLINTLKGDFEKAVWSLFVAMVMDLLDGKVARITKTTSDFGIEFDSLSDLVSFGVAPAILVYMWQLVAFEKLGAAISFMLVASTAIRLARFNVLSQKGFSKDFVGLPSPASCGLIASFYLFAEHYIRDYTLLPYLLLVLTFSSSILMVSGFRYRSLKGNFNSEVPFKALVVSVFLIVATISNPYLMLFLIFLTYTLSGPIFKVLALLRQKEKEEGREVGV